MSTHNVIVAAVKCPRCGWTTGKDIEGFVGTGELREYRLGDRIRWADRKSVRHGGRPPDGTIDAEGYAVCENCGKDFFLILHVKNDILSSVEPDVRKPGHIK
ncbi:hypothetical protein SOCEGT47_077540 [Sorangium cellulosum]|uniref:Uncharacterized protein n=1 Tax=Sorangium cellulosum TaxID=56 RepID=A0A4P2QDE3_SORCE|nr:hypothetical protein SOCEGT47_077540 [Sorangium cellulosum]